MSLTAAANLTAEQRVTECLKAFSFAHLNSMNATYPNMNKSQLIAGMGYQSPLREIVGCKALSDEFVAYYTIPRKILKGIGVFSAGQIVTFQSWKNIIASGTMTELTLPDEADGDINLLLEGYVSDDKPYVYAYMWAGEPMQPSKYNGDLTTFLAGVGVEFGSWGPEIAELGATSLGVDGHSVYVDDLRPTKFSDCWCFTVGYGKTDLSATTITQGSIVFFFEDKLVLQDSGVADDPKYV